MLVQLYKRVVVCGSDLQMGHSGDGHPSSSILFKYESSRGHLFASSRARHDGLPGECRHRAMHGEWHGACDFAVLSAVRHELTMVVRLCFTFVLTLPSSMALGPLLLHVACFPTLGCCLLCRDAAQWACGVL